MGKSKKRHSDGTGLEGATEKPDAVSGGDIFHRSLEELKQALDILGFEITPKRDTVAQTISSPIADVIKESRKRKMSSSSNTETDNEPCAKKHKHRKHHKGQGAATGIPLPATNSNPEMPLMNSTPLKAGKFPKSVPMLIFSSQGSSSELDFSLAKMSPLNSSKRRGNIPTTVEENTQIESEKSAKKANKRKSKEGKTALPSEQLGKPVKERTVPQKHLSPSAFGGDWTRQELAAVDAKKLNLLEKYFVGKKDVNKKEKTPTNKQKTVGKKHGDTNLNPVVIGSPEKKDTKKKLPEGKTSPAKKAKVDSVTSLSTAQIQKNTKTKQIEKSPKKHPVSTNQEIPSPQVTSGENTKKSKKHKKESTLSNGIETNVETVSLATESQPEESTSQESKKKSHKKKKKKNSKMKEEEEHETLKESSPMKIVSFTEFIGNDVETNSAPKKVKKSKGRDKQGNITPENLKGKNTQTIIQSKIESKKSTISEKLKTIKSKQETEPLKKKSKKKRKSTENESLDNIKPNEECVNQNETSPVVSKVTKNTKGKSDKESVVSKSKVLALNKSNTTTQNTTSAVAKDSKTAKRTKKNSPPKMDVPAKTPPKKKVPIKTTPKKDVPTKTPPKKDVPAKTPPKKKVPIKTTPKKDVPTKTPPKKEVNVVKAPRPTAKSKRPTADEQRFRKSFDFDAWEEKMKMIELLTSGDSGEKSESEVSTPTYIKSLGMFSFEPAIGDVETKTRTKTKKKKKKKDKEK